MPDARHFPRYFREYSWQSKHSLYGYPPDTFKAFEWIGSLERRFKWLEANHTDSKTSALGLIREMIQWGGSQNGILQRFDEGLGDVCLYEALSNVITSLGTRSDAIRAALEFPGLGLTYASKLLRFLDPDSYGALDSRIRNALRARAPESGLPRIYDGNLNSMVYGYTAFLDYIDQLKLHLDNGALLRPNCALPPGQNPSQWRAADIEMALFRWGQENDTQ